MKIRVSSTEANDEAVRIVFVDVREREPAQTIRIEVVNSAQIAGTTTPMRTLANR